ncbi:MAG: rhodanese-like domain-containing protein [Pedococcus sp.]
MTTTPALLTTNATPTPAGYWESQQFSGAPSSTPERGWGAPTCAGIDDQLAEARSRLRRISVRAAYQEVLHGRALLVDIRPAAQRAAEGEVAAHLFPLVVERNVLEWRFDPRHEARLPQAGWETRVLVLCQEGFTSSLAADALLHLGVLRSTDVVGGFKAWREAGLPMQSRNLVG